MVAYIEMTILKEWKLGFGKWEKKMRDPSTPRKERIELHQDSAYQGGESVFPGTNFITPFKKNLVAASLPKSRKSLTEITAQNA